MDRYRPLSALAGSRGQALVPTLAAILIVGLGALATLRWTAQLMRFELELRQRVQALDLLENLFEGWREVPNPMLEGTTYTWSVSASHEPLAADPARGAHEDIVIQWRNAQGSVQSARLRTYRTPPARLH